MPEGKNNRLTILGQGLPLRSSPKEAGSVSLICHRDSADGVADDNRPCEKKGLSALRRVAEALCEMERHSLGGMGARQRGMNANGLGKQLEGFTVAPERSTSATINSQRDICVQLFFNIPCARGTDPPYEDRSFFKWAFPPAWFK